MDNRRSKMETLLPPAGPVPLRKPSAVTTPLLKLKESVREDLEKQEYFHGFRPRKDLQHLLKEPHEFLVRATDGGGGAAEIVVTVLNEKKEQLHLTLCHENNKWQFTVFLQQKKWKKKKSKEDGKQRPLVGFNSVCELVKYYKDHRVPGKAYLKKGIPHPKWLITHDKVDYKLTDLLGSGAFCHVYRGKYRRTEEDVYEVAVKVCHEGKLATETNEESKEARKAMISEAQAMAQYVHECIITLHGVAMSHPPILIVMEYCAGGNLEQHLTQSGDKIETGERVIYALEAARGMRYLHDQGCVHRDLAARNCLISSKGTIKISDFGLSMLIEDAGKKEGELDLGRIPVRWMPPETLKAPPLYSVKSDVWSYAVLLYEIFNNGVKPFPDDPPKKVATLIRRLQMPAFPEKAPKEVKEVVAAIWIMDAEQRPTIGKAYRKLFNIIKKRSFLPPADLKDWAVNRIPGVRRSEDGLKHLIGDETDDRCETKSKDAMSKDDAEPTIKRSVESLGPAESATPTAPSPSVATSPPPKKK